MVNIKNYFKQEQFGIGNYYRNPLLNEQNVDMYSAFTSEDITMKKTILEYFKGSPLVISVISALVTDVVSDGYEFDGAKSNIDRALDFAKKNYLSKILEAAGYDYFSLGNGLIYKGGLTEEKLKAFVQDFMKRRSYSSYGGNVKEYLEKKAYDELATGERKIKHLPASTVEVYPSDKFGSEYLYKQRVNVSESIFTEDEIIHFMDIPLDGKKWGFARFESIMDHLDLYNFIMKYQQGYFKNKPGMYGVYILKNKSPTSLDYKKFVEQLRIMKNPNEFNSTLVVTGDTEFKEFSRMKDMEFKTLADWAAEEAALLWQMPPSRYGKGGSGNSQETALSTQAYFRNVSHIQSKWEEVLNNELFEPMFKVEFRFKRSYLEDEVRESQMMKTRADYTQQMLELGLINLEYAAKLNNIREDDRPKELGKSQIEILRSRSKMPGKNNQSNDWNSNDEVMDDMPTQQVKKSHTPKSNPKKERMQK
uniref:Putative portal protein n=1 Tax=viral metagenome TaxID=1070528 RepID=A0A6M3LC54_9ZZZZ